MQAKYEYKLSVSSSSAAAPDRDLPDLRSIAKLHYPKMNWNRIGEYAKLLDMEEIIDEIRG
jgi:hypothetical protein